MPPEANDHPEQPRQPAPGPPAKAEPAPGPAQPPAERAPAPAQPPAERPAPLPDATPRASDAERNHALDRLRAAVLSGQVTTITAVAIMGGIEVIVPPGIRVESSGFGFMGGWDNRASDDRLAPDAPVLRVRGLALMGGVEIRTKEPRDPRGPQPTTGSA